MLVLTSNAFSSGSASADPFPDWPGPQVAVILPGSGLARSSITSLVTRSLVIERLSPPSGLFDILADIAQFMPERLRTDEGPLLILDRAPEADDLALQASDIGPLEVDVVTDSSGMARRALIGDLISTSPLFPRFFRMVEKHQLSDAAFFKLLTEFFVWEAA